MKVQALLNGVFIKPPVLRDGGKRTHDPSTPTVDDSGGARGWGGGNAITRTRRSRVDAV